MAEVKNKQTFEKPIAAVLISLPIVKASALETSAAAGDTAAVLAKIDGITIDAVYRSKDGNATYPFSNISLLPVLEHGQISEGAINVVYDDTYSGYVLKAMVSFSKVGAIPFSDDETLEIEVIRDDVFFGAPTYDSLEHPVYSPVFTEFNRLSVTDGAKEKDFEVHGVDTLMIPLNDLTATTAITFFHTNGRNVRYTREHLEAMGRQSNDVVLNLNGKIHPGFGRYAIIDADTIARIEVRRNSTSAFDIITVQDEPVNDLTKVASSNRKMVSLSEGNLVTKLQTALTR